MTCLVIALSSPSGPVRSSPLARAALTSSRTAARSASPGFAAFTACLGIELMPLSVSVIADQPSSPTIIGVSARNTVQRTVPPGDRPAVVDDQLRQPQPGALGQG